MRDDASGLEARVAGVMRTEGLVRPGDRVLAAVSGGADSVALLLLLCATRPALGIEVEAAHFEHGIRGEASLADAAFAEALCGRLGVRCHVGHGDVPVLAAAWRCGLEDAARRARYAYLDETARAVGAARIALAHQLEDQAETLLLHLVHGSGLRGLSGMRPVSGNRIRPLLGVGRAELEAYLTARGEGWREDETNRDTAYARNFLRHEVFPALRRMNPRVAEAMARTAGIAAESDAALARAARARLAGHVRRMPCGAFWWVGREPPTPETVRAFAQWAGVPPLDARQTAALAALPPGGTANLPGNWHGLRTRERLHLLRDGWMPPPVDRNALTAAPAAPGALGDGIRTQALDADRLDGAVLRRRMPGDVFAPLGMAGTQKLKQTLNDAGIDRPFRDLLPVLAAGNRVLWIVGLKPGRDAAIMPGTRRAVMLTYHGDLPWEIDNDGGWTDAEPEKLADVPGPGGDFADE